MKQNKIIGDREEKKPIEELLRKAAEDSAFREAFGEKVGKPEEKKPEHAKQASQETESNSNYDAESLKLEEIMDHGGLMWNVRAVDFTDDIQYLAVGYGAGALRVVYIPHIEEGVRQDMGSDVRGISIDTTNGHIAVGTKNRKLMIYETDFNGYHLSRHLAKPIEIAKQPSRINDVAFDKSGDNIAVVGGKHGKQDGFLRIYSFFPEGIAGISKLHLYREKLHMSPLTAVTFTPDHNILVGGKDMRVYSSKDSRKDPEIIEHGSGWTSALAFSKDGEYLAAGHHGLLRVRKYLKFIKSGYLPILATVDFPKRIVHGLSFSHDGKYLAATGGMPHRKTDEGKCGFIKVYEIK